MEPSMTTLLGPPETYDQSLSATTKSDGPFMDLMVTDFNNLAIRYNPPMGLTETYDQSLSATTKSDGPFMDLMVTDFNNLAIRYNPPMGLTENCSPTFLSTGNPLLDFFFHVVPDTPPEVLVELLRLAWKEDPLKALRLVCNLRGVRGTGKSDKEGFYTAALWLHKYHPRTLASNVASFARFGYCNDLLEILFRLLEVADARKLREAAVERAVGGRWGNCRIVQRANMLEKIDSNLSREEKRIAWARRVIDRFNRDPDFRFLHDRVSDFFAESLRSDMKLLDSGDVFKISLAAKWCPSLDSSFDKITLLCETIARKVFPKEEYPEYQGIEDAHYAYRVRDRLRKQVLVPLRKALELPEVYIGANDWGSIPYHRVASVAMKMYKDKFLKHDKERFLEYLQNVKTGETKIAAGAWLPHEIVPALGDEDGGEVMELQPKRMVDGMAEKGKLNNCLAICDVSGSMSGAPMDVSMALGLLVSELSQDPWKGKIITFSQDPELHMIKGDSLDSKTSFIRNMEWGTNTNFQKVFDLILQVAVDGGLKADQMIKRLFVFSDMEFDQASEVPWETDYEAIVRKFRECGYGDCVPEIVFWNLRDSRATPVSGNQAGVALVSGFSKNLMRLFLEDSGSLNPESIMEAAISGEDYKKLVVID